MMVGKGYGIDPCLRQINAVLVSYYLAQAIFFVFVFGALISQLYVFLRALGFGVSLNNGVCRKPALRAAAAGSPSGALLEPA